jgi:hypothetical protein
MEDSTRTTLDYALPPSPPPPDGGRAAIGWMFAAMLLGGLACVLLAMLLGGPGHGWSPALRISWVAVFASPLSAVAWAMRRRAVRNGVALLLLAAAIIADLTLLSATRSEEIDSFIRVWSSAPMRVTVWAMLWAAWQVVALGALLWPQKVVEDIRSD